MKNMWIKVLLFSIFMTVNCSFATTKVIDRVIAIVNDDVILKSDIDQLILSMKVNTKQTLEMISNNILLQHQILEHLIMNKIILQTNYKNGLLENEKQFNQIIFDFSRQNNMTIDQMKKFLYYNGINYNIYFHQIYEDMLASKICDDEIRSRMIISPQEINSFINQKINFKKSNIYYNLSCIFIPFTKKNITDNQIIKIKEQAKNIVKLAINYSNFNKLTNKYYPYFNVSIKNYLIGWRNIHELPLVFSYELNKKKKGDIVGPIRFINGFYILKVNDIRLDNRGLIFTKVHVGHIFLKKSQSLTNEQAWYKLNRIAESINQGKITFNNAAKIFSHDIYSANHGGDLGWTLIDVYNPIVRDELMLLGLNQISPPIRSSAGWHLIKLMGLHKVYKFSITYKDKIFEILFKRKYLEELFTWMQEQRTNAYVKILDNQ